MSENSEIFSREVPGQKRFMAAIAKQEKAPATETKPKRQYNRKSPPPLALKTVSSQGKVPTEIIPNGRYGSYDLEYIQALTRLLELLHESSRDRLVSFLITAKIM